ncbi:VOC family protein [Paenibacillus albus]|uniref:VOC family protein n=1 Tax=Paenibacillus albus TaxID=2495582 RepID=A0A3S9AAG4_9BACL|nr:VOC family protein [Paenibacillus albus]AZN42713.1 VOC family protein [Paenibacillus albus]
MTLKHVGSIFIPVSSLEQSIAWYTERLGLVCRGIEDWGGGSRGATLFFQPHPEHAALLSLAERMEPIQTEDFPRFNFQCDDAETLHAELQATNGRVTELELWDSEWNHHVLFDVFDPDGNRINIIQVTPHAQIAKS